jgi:hypothetical protein
MQIARIRSVALLLGLVVMPLAGTTLADPSPTPSGKRRTHGTVTIRKEWDANTPSAEPSPRRRSPTKYSNIVLKPKPASKPIAAAKATPSPRATPIPKKAAKKN